MAAPTKSDSNAAWTQQMQQAQPCRKRRAQDGDIMMDRGDPQFFAAIGGVSGGRKSPRTTGRISYTDAPDVEIHEDRLGYEPPSSAPPAISTAAPAPPAIHTGVDAINFLASIAEDLKDPMAPSDQ